MPENNSRSRQIDAKLVNADDMVSMFKNIDRLRNSDFAFCWHRFPTTKEELQAALKGIGADGKDRTNIIVNGYDTVIYELNGVLPQFADLDELNYLAVKMDGLTEAQHNIFRSVVEAGRHCESIKDVINITENLDCFDIQPAYSSEMYGEFLSVMGGDEFSGTIEKLEKSHDPDMRDLAAYITRLEKYFDSEAYGRDVVKAENGVFTEQGYLTESEGFREVYRGPEDIPNKFRILSRMEASVSVKNTDLTDLMVKILALGGEYMSPARPYVQMLAQGDTKDYLLILSDGEHWNTADLCTTASCYQYGEDECQILLNNMAETKRAFALHIRSREDGHAFGDITEVDFDNLRLDIQQNAIHFERVGAVLDDGSERTYSVKEWDEVSVDQRDEFDIITMFYNPDNVRALNAHLVELRRDRGAVDNVKSPDEFLRNLNNAFMEKAKKTQSDMLRVDYHAAEGMLMHSDAPVYRLTPDGPKQLTPLDALSGRGGLKSGNCREFAIKKEDQIGFEKWAKREVDAAVKRLPERASPGKGKNRDQEL